VETKKEKWVCSCNSGDCCQLLDAGSVAPEGCNWPRIGEVPNWEIEESMPITSSMVEKFGHHEGESVSPGFVCSECGQFHYQKVKQICLECSKDG